MSNLFLKITGTGVENDSASTLQQPSLENSALHVGMKLSDSHAIVHFRIYARYSLLVDNKSSPVVLYIEFHVHA